MWTRRFRDKNSNSVTRGEGAIGIVRSVIPRFFFFFFGGYGKEGKKLFVKKLTERSYNLPFENVFRSIMWFCSFEQKQWSKSYKLYTVDFSECSREIDVRNRGGCRTRIKPIGAITYTTVHAHVCTTRTQRRRKQRIFSKVKQ